MKNTYRQLTIKYAFLQSTYWISQCIIYSFAAVFLQYKNFNNTQIGIVLSLSAILSIVLQPAISAFADKSKKKTVRYIILTILLIVFGITVIFNIWNNSFIIIASIFVIINALQITLIPLLNSIALEFLNNGYPFNFGLARGTASIAFAFTSYLLGHAVNRFSPSIILPLFLISYVLLFIAAYIFRVKTPMNTLGGNEDRVIHPPASVLGFFIKYKRFSFLLIGITMVFYSHSLINTFLINIIENAGGDSADMGLSLTIAAALELPMMAAFTLLVKKVKCSTLIKISGFFFFIKSATIWLAPNVMAVHFSQGFQMLSFAMFTPASVYYVNSIINEEDKNKGQAILGAATIGVAGTIANISGGKLLDISGVSDMMMLGTLVALVGFAIILFSTEKSH
ncbi:MAG: MFS transporter [Clostridiales bacterium]|jgi:PPP family 3-phenylpropionic acid transporter|nr:MFS transporter [Clostridiales bacterium]